MFSFIRLCCVGWFCLGLFLSLSASVASAQEDKDEAEKVRNLKADQARKDKILNEYRQFFKQPKTPLEYWVAIKFEISLGKFEIAGYFIKSLVEMKPADKVDRALVDIQEDEGYYPFLHLQDIKTWSDHPPFQEEAKASV